MKTGQEHCHMGEVSDLDVEGNNKYEHGPKMELSLAGIAREAKHQIDERLKFVAIGRPPRDKSILEAGGRGNMATAENTIRELHEIDTAIKDEGTRVIKEINSLSLADKNLKGDIDKTTNDDLSDDGGQPDETETERNIESLVESMLVELEEIVVYNFRQMVTQLKEGDSKHLIQSLSQSNIDHMLSLLAVEFLKINQPTESGRTEELNSRRLLRDTQRNIATDFWNKFEAKIPVQDNTDIFRQLDLILNKKRLSLAPWSHKSNINCFLGEIINAKRIALLPKRENSGGDQKEPELINKSDDRAPLKSAESIVPVTEPWTALDTSWENFRFEELSGAEVYAKIEGMSKEEWLLKDLNQFCIGHITPENLGEAKVGVAEDEYINKIAGRRIKRIVLIFPTTQQMADFESKYLGMNSEGSDILGHNFHLKHDSYKHYFMSKDGIILSSDESYTLRHEMLHSVDPNRNHREKENAMLTEMFGYWSQAKFALEEGLISPDQLWGDSYASFFSHRSYYDRFKPDIDYEEYSDLALQVAAKARQIYELEGEVSMMRDIGESRTVQEFLEK